MMVVLIGYMGSGKSTVGKVIAKKRGMGFIDFDDYIEEKEQLTIPEIFKQKGEIYFRKQETAYLSVLLKEKPNAVISLGGGTPCFGNNMDVVVEATQNVFYLKLSVEKLVERLQAEKEHRPLIKDIADIDLSDFIRKHLFERNFFYLRSHHIITVGDETPQGISEKIEKKLV
ncbi:AAA family ATPase [Galbibacter sp. EGI 63066]|uniref:shikimate kinase n=1 Tax=Galbibacter sp. EGI 63066 TaxID=2993559 RepID=UPI0022487B9C|nr:shikimate kinase [Galbibacter sp. EGI 63066]MCX2680728.1 AAA family ATPase [Galbibacter sp. EGI 63066]